ncbi:nitroreductase family protein [Candidatus Uabimicrobium sp. HlEnr_7]|uniref:nitroreductase family protein n=1 Tax=Candidatus Uabimicrobium helgolandensis TaxID=3095367 RepID=UPI003556D477
MSIESFRKIVENRRSVRRFTNEEVPKDIVNDCLRLALLAPNSSNLQPWEFYTAYSEEAKKQITKACFNQNAAKTAAVIIVVVGRTNTWKQNSQKLLNEWPTENIPRQVVEYYTKTVSLLYTQGPASILGFCRRILMSLIGLFRPVPRGPFNKTEMRTWAAKTCALAAENIMLSLKAHGFDSCPMEGFDEKRIRKILNLPADAFTVMIIGAGKKADDGIYYPRMRFSVENHVFEL